jgi:uncharacterized membrane protein YozB (DUF420 family)
LFDGGLFADVASDAPPTVGLLPRLTLWLQKTAALLVILILAPSGRMPVCSRFKMTIFDLPPMNASLNGLSTLLICGGWISILLDRKSLHISFILTALAYVLDLIVIEKWANSLSRSGRMFP